MTDFTTPSLSPTGLPISDDAGSYQATEWLWMRNAAPLSTYMVEGRWVTRFTGSVVITAAGDNAQPMLVRLYYPTTGYLDLGYVDPGEQATFPFDITGLDRLLDDTNQYDPEDMRVLWFYFLQDGAPGTGYTINALDVVFHTTDVDPHSLLVTVEDTSIESANIGDLSVANLLNSVLVSPAGTLQDWLDEATGSRVARIELEGDQQPHIVVEFDDINYTYGMSLDDDLPLPDPGTYTQEYRLRLYTVNHVEEGEDTLTEVTVFDQDSDFTGVVSFTLLGEGGGTGCSIPVFSRTMPACN